MKIIFDENFSLHLTEGLACFQQGKRCEGIEVNHMIEVFNGSGTADEKWIPVIAQMHAVVVTQDFDIHRTRHLYEMLQEYKIGIFFFRPPKKSNYSYWHWIDWVLSQWSNIKELAKSASAPFGYSITPRSKTPEYLSPISTRCNEKALHSGLTR
jgi:hypothetical protein